MTIAICLKCGEFKHGAWNPCPKCRFTPEDDESMTKHLLVSDHYLSREQQEEISAKVKAGKEVEFPPEILKQAWVNKAELDKEFANLMRRVGIGCGVAFAIIVVAVVIYIIWPLL